MIFSCAAHVIRKRLQIFRQHIWQKRGDGKPWEGAAEGIISLAGAAGENNFRIPKI